MKIADDRLQLLIDDADKAGMAEVAAAGRELQALRIVGSHLLLRYEVVKKLMPHVDLDGNIGGEMNSLREALLKE